MFGKLSWLWFLLVLFEVFLLNFAIIIWLKRRKANEEYMSHEDGRLVFIHLATFTVWSTISAQSVSANDASLLLKANLIMNLFYVLLAAAIKLPYLGQFAGPAVSLLMTTQKYG